VLYITISQLTTNIFFHLTVNYYRSVIDQVKPELTKRDFLKYGGLLRFRNIEILILDALVKRPYCSLNDHFGAFEINCAFHADRICFLISEELPFSFHISKITFFDPKTNCLGPLSVTSQNVMVLLLISSRKWVLVERHCSFGGKSDPPQMGTIAKLKSIFCVISRHFLRSYIKQI